MSGAIRERSAFARTVQVTIDIAAPPDAVWDRLTDAAALPTWNSTVDAGT